MRMFVDPTVPPRDTLGFRNARAYTEYEFPIAGGGAFVLYLVGESIDSDEFCISACLGSVLDQHIKFWERPDDGDKWMALFCETYPTFGQLWANSVADHLENGALRMMNDPDDSGLKPVITVSLTIHWDRNDTRTVFEADELVPAFKIAVDRGTTLLNELSTNEIDVGRALELGIASAQEGVGLRQYKEIAGALGKVVDWVGFLSQRLS